MLWLGAANLQAQANYELAVTGKMTEIKWKQADLLVAQRELAILNQFLGTYEAKTADLELVRQQLASADTRLASIQQGNLVKLTLRMGIETYSTVADTINLGKTAATALITRGLASAVGDVALDKLSGALTDQGKAALGLDAETLGSPRTVKIKAVSDAARAAYPGLARVQQALALSLEAVKSAAYHEDGTELGDTGAILRKNIMVRDEITAALGKLDLLGTEAADAKTDADPRLPAAQATVEQLAADLAALTAELVNLKAQWSTAEAAAQLAANQAALVPPVHQPIPTVTVVRTPEETDWEYQARVYAAILAAAQARWNTESPALLAAITGTKTQLTATQNGIEASVAAQIYVPSVDGFIYAYGGSDTVDASTTASYSGSIGTAASLEQWVAAVAPAVAVLPGLITDTDTLTDHYTTLVNTQNRLASLQQLLAELSLPTPAVFYVAMASTGMGQGVAEDLAITLNQYRDQLPLALAHAQTQLDQLYAATTAWSSGIGQVASDIDDNLAAAESALTALIAQGTVWNNALTAATGLTLDATEGWQHSRLGYFSGSSYVPVVRKAFDLSVYKTSLLAAITTPGAAGVAACRVLRARFDTLVASTPPLKDAYDAAWQRYQTAYAHVQAYAGPYFSFPVYQDWTGAAAYSSTAHPVNASGVTDQAARFLFLYYTATTYHLTSLSGGAPVVGQPVLQWAGLPQMRQLADPGFDEPETYLPHRLIALKAVLIEDGPGWIPFAPEAFNARYNDTLEQLWLIQDEAYNQADDPTMAAIYALFGEFNSLYTRYTTAHPVAVITVQPADSVNPIPAGTTYSPALSVTASGDFLRYQWAMTRWTDDTYGWEDLAGATAATLTSPALTETRWFRVTISNPGGTVVSNTAKVQVYQVYPQAHFTSAAAASGQVGVAFTWTFTTDIPCWISLGHMMLPLPPGLYFNPMTATLAGTPTADGSWALEVMAFNNGTPSNQTFHLTIVPGTLGAFPAWLQTWTTAAQRLDPAFTSASGTPAGDGVANLLKYACNFLGTGPGQVTALDFPCTTSLTGNGTAGLPSGALDASGRLTLRYLRRKVAAAPGITYEVVFADTLAVEAWSVNAAAAESVTSLDDTWERVLVTDDAARAGPRFVRLRVTQP